MSALAGAISGVIAEAEPNAEEAHAILTMIMSALAMQLCDSDPDKTKNLIRAWAAEWAGVEVRVIPITTPPKGRAN